MLNQNYWETRYQNNQTGWDAGEITTPLKEYFDQLTNKNLRILIPGAGNAYEAEYLHKNNFTNVTVLDLASQPLANIKNRIADFPEDHLIQGDFFEHHQKYDLIVEQTFFCALNPHLRSEYAKKMSELLNPGGKLVGVLFNTQFEGGPPFGGDTNEYRTYFEPYFRLLKFETCVNSIKPRSNKEIFILIQKK